MEFSSQAKTENHTVFLEKSSKQQPFVFLIGETLDSSTMKDCPWQTVTCLTSSHIISLFLHWLISLCFLCSHSALIEITRESVQSQIAVLVMILDFRLIIMKHSGWDFVFKETIHVAFSQATWYQSVFIFTFPVNYVVEVMSRLRKYVCWQSAFIRAEGGGYKTSQAKLTSLFWA